MEVKIINNTAIILDGENERRIDLTRDYMGEVDKIIAGLENKLTYFRDIKDKIYNDQKIILEHFINKEEK